MSSLLPSLGKTLGAVYIGATLSSILLGITALQAVIYYKKFPNDAWYYRYSVAALWILDLLHVALNTHAIYFYLIDSFGNYLALDHVIWSFKLQILINVIIVVGVQALTLRSTTVEKFSDTIFTVSYLGLLCWLLLVAAVIFLLTFVLDISVDMFFKATGIGESSHSTVMTYDAYTLSHVSLLPTISKTVDGTFATTTSVDFIISGAMFYYLHKSTTITKFESTISLILSLMRVVVISGLVTSTCSLLALMTFIAFPNTLIFFAIGFILPKLYINSLLAMLNARDKLVKGSESHGTPQVLRLTSENYSDMGMMERGIDMSLAEIPGVTALDKI
ncbi:uncharacterized protein EV420DRAFT_1652212 [Desarmillaria tabescens]|uniref:DUF6534 domain-containing protein n=1 Tax=Armillaria tabescens TaxID=1929756 RepID=A0AA39JAD9_ARMTA|nr:uncharacterized protein EV420DRAFT_1652212 [Desarmillaria tabescens]KAK0437083.1 hypothetical protein EV420DRAFT_1652212 [Desarmillaria tabescens]